MTDFSAKRAGETEIFTVDFVNLVTSGATIISAVWTNSVKQAAPTGADPTPNAMISGPSTIVGTQVSTKIAAGIAGTIYSPICTATTSDGEVLILPEFGAGALVID